MSIKCRLKSLKLRWNNVWYSLHLQQYSISTLISNLGYLSILFGSVRSQNNSASKYITNKNEKYEILSIYGVIDYIEDFDSCLQKRDEIVEVLPNMFPNAQKTEDIFAHSSDPSGNSIVDAVYFVFDSGAKIEISCDNFEETYRIRNRWSEGLNVAIKYEEISSWMRDY